MISYSHPPREPIMKFGNGRNVDFCGDSGNRKTILQEKEIIQGDGGRERSSNNSRGVGGEDLFNCHHPDLTSSCLFCGVGSS